jgi:pyruvate,orthophosphate dikinase
MTSHAALVARGWGKCCIVGCNAIVINKTKKYFKVENIKIYQDDWITLNGSNGHVYIGQLPLVKPKVNKNILFNNFLSVIKKNSKLSVRANADSAKDAKNALSLGATGIGLCRTEHMFFKPNRIIEIRKMIIAKNSLDRNRALMKILPFQQNDFYRLLKSMNNMPVTIRLLDPHLH